MTATEDALAAWAAEQEVRAQRAEAYNERAVDGARRWWRQVFGEQPVDVYVVGEHVSALAPDSLLLRFPLRPGGYVEDPVVIVRCPACREQMPAYSRAAVTLADVGQAIAAGPGPHEKPSEAHPGTTIPCEGGPTPAAEPVPSPADMLLTVLDALVRDAVTNLLGERAQA